MAPENKTINTVKITFIITIIAVVSKILGFARDAVLAHYYGSTTITDIFITTLSLPDILYELIANAITIGFVPIATAVLINSNNKKEVNRFASNVIYLFEVLAVIFVILFNLFSKQIIEIAAPGFSGESIEKAAFFLRLMSIAIIFKTLSSVFGAYMQSNKRFVPVSMYGAIMDIVIIAFIIISVNRDDDLLAYGVLVGVFSQMIFATVCAYNTGFRFEFTLDYKDEKVRSMLIMFLPALAATGANQIIQIVNKAMATTVVEGGVTIISNANKMGFAAENIIVLSIAAVIYPLMSEYANSHDLEGFVAKLQRGLNSTFVIMIPLSCALIGYSYPIIDLLFGHGKYIDAVGDTSILMKIYCLGIIGLSSYTIMVRALYAQKMVKQAALCAIISLLINVLLCVTFTKPLGLGLYGIAEATSITYTLSFVITIFILRSKVGNFGFKKMMTVFVKSTIASAPMMLISYVVFILVKRISVVLGLSLCAIVGIVVYFGIMCIFKVDEVYVIMNQVRRRIKHN